MIAAGSSSIEARIGKNSDPSILPLRMNATCTPASPPGALGHGHDVGVSPLDADDLLPFEHMPDGRNPVAQLRRALEVPAVRRLLHLLLERREDLVAPPAQEESGGVDGGHVVVVVDGRDAGRGALLHVEVETDLLVAGDLLSHLR